MQTESMGLGRFRPLATALLRIVTAGLFWQHGMMKLFGWFGGQAVPTFSLFWFAGVIEAIAPLLIVVGLFTRPVALLLCGEMAVAYLTQHLPGGFWPIQNQGILALQYCVIFLILTTTGAGAVSIDGILEAKPRGRGRVVEILDSFYPAALTILRVVTAFLFWQFGARKVLGSFGGRVAQAGTRLWVAGMMETLGAPFILVGALTRVLSFIFAGEMAVAYWTSHFPRGQFWPIQNGGEAAVLFCFIYLFLVTAGAGPYSVDALFSRKHHNDEERATSRY
jgi:putative oxidoreductase